MKEISIMQGYKESKRITKKFAKTFYFASKFLSKEKRNASYSIYAICRISDDSVDNLSSVQRHNLYNIKKDIDLAYTNQEINNPLLLAFRETTTKYQIPKDYFDELIKGMEMDLVKNRYETFEELYQYCYRVAGIVGLIMLKILGYNNKEAENYAIQLGVAMQLTNILRDIKEDYQRNRIYLPLKDLAEFNVTEGQIKDCHIDFNFINLMNFQIKRARKYYENASLGIEMIPDSNSRLVILLMKEMYSAILDSIIQNGYNVLKVRTYVPLYKKIIILITTLVKVKY